MSDTLPAFLLPVIAQLRRRKLPVGLPDVQALRLALRAGFGLSSRDALRDLCVTLWAKSPAEALVVRAAFANIDPQQLADWTTLDSAEAPPPTDAQRQPDAGDGDQPLDPAPGGAGEVGDSESPPAGTVAIPGADLRPLDLGALRTLGADGGLIMVPQYPLNEREVAQAWRSLRRPVRSGPAVELDLRATVADWARRGVATPPVLVPRRRNAARLLLLLDRQGSMTPFHQYVDYVVGAIGDAGRIDDVRAAYFHDVPGSQPDHQALAAAPDPFGSDLDAVLGLIAPLRDGTVYHDPGLTVPQPLAEVLDGLTAHTAVLVISDAGAARRQFDLIRLLDTIALIKAVRDRGAERAWLNPVPRRRWARTTAASVARHVPMFPFNRLGLDQAVDALRGRLALVERPV